MPEEIIRKHLHPSGEFIFGFANLTGLLPPELDSFPYGISIGRRLDPTIVDEILEGPTLRYYRHYREVNDELQGISEAIAAELRENGHEVFTITPSVTTGQLDTVYEKDLRTPLSHKMVATRAGLGWIGKTDLFVSLEFGPRLRLVSILTKTPLSPIKPAIDRSLCGTCSVCVRECPAQAATGEPWDISLDRDVFFNAKKCRAQCKRFGEEKLKSDIRICGICVAVCPLGC
jgi:epoxyqueuosine reductase QueG